MDEISKYNKIIYYLQNNDIICNPTDDYISFIFVNNKIKDIQLMDNNYYTDYRSLTFPIHKFDNGKLDKNYMIQLLNEEINFITLNKINN